LNHTEEIGGMVTGKIFQDIQESIKKPPQRFVHRRVQARSACTLEKLYVRGGCAHVLGSLRS
jgi:hypothetical protein